MSSFVVNLKTECGGNHLAAPNLAVGCEMVGCPGFTYKEVPLEAALLATLKSNEEFAKDLARIFGYRPVRRDAVKPSEIL